MIASIRKLFRRTQEWSAPVTSVLKAGPRVRLYAKVPIEQLEAVKVLAMIGETITIWQTNKFAWVTIQEPEQPRAGEEAGR